MSVDLVAQNVETIAAVRARAGRDASRQQRAIERVTLLIGRPTSFYVALVAVASWIALNVALGVGALDPPPFHWLHGTVSLVGLVTAITVLTTQIRQTRHAEERAQLDLQVNLVAEQKTAKIIALLEELRRDLPNVRDRHDPIAHAMSEAVDPEAVMSALQVTFDGPADQLPRGRTAGMSDGRADSSDTNE